LSGDREDETDFASRWSRLKRQAKAEAPEADADLDAAAEGESEAPVEDDRSDAEVLEELGLPDPDKLEPGDNFSGFMAKTVPARLRNRALRRLWISDPVLANLDELLDYGEDFTDAAALLENVQTAYQVGKGFVDKMTGSPEEPPEEPVETGEEPGEVSGEDSDEDDVVRADSAAEAAPEAAPEVATEAAPEVALEEPGEKAAPGGGIPVRKRMQFRVAEE